MCDQTEVNYKQGDVVWVKLGCYFWPGEVQDVDKLDEEILVSFKKKPIAAVKFFDEDKYEYVKNLSQICLYNCRKKHDYIKKGLDMYRKQKEGSYMDKFPDDVRKAEMRTGGNPDILSDAQFQPQEKSNYQGLFGSEKKGKPSTPKQVSAASTNGRKSQTITPVRNPPRHITITHPRFVTGETEHKVHIRQQPISTPETGKSPTTSTSATAAYKCQLCDFTSNRLNVIVLHNKFHSATSPNNNAAKGKSPATKTKTSSPKVRATTASAEAKTKLKPKAKAKSPSKDPEALSKTGASNLTTTPKISSPTKVSAIKRKILEESTVDTEDIEEEKTMVPESTENKRPKVSSPENQENKQQTTVVSDSPQKKIPKSPEKSQDILKSPVSGKRKGSRGDEKAAKKTKNDEEIREKLLADWDDEDAEQEEKEMELLKQKLVKSDNGTASHSSEVSTVLKSDEINVASCFDFDDSKDAILDSELEERAKKFVENRKVPRVIDEKAEKLNYKQVLESTTTLELVDSSTSQPEIETEGSASAEDFDKAINNLLAETAVPKLPDVPLGSSEPCKSSSLLPDVVLDSSLAVGNENKSELVQETTTAEVQGGDHDYSAKQKDNTMLVNPPFEDDDILDINSMPVVMADAVITDGPSTSQLPLVNIQMPKIDLIPNPNSANTHTIVVSDGRLEMPPSVQSVVKAVRASTVDRSKPAVKQVSIPQVSGTLTQVSNRAGSNVSRLQSAEKLTPARGARLLQQGIASGKYVIVQPSGTAQPRLTPKTNTPQQVTSVKPVAGSSQQQINLQSPGSGKLVIITKPQSGGQQQVLTALTPAQQKALVAGGKLPPPQRLLTSTGQLLTPVNPRNAMAKGTKLTPVTGQQMRTITAGKQTLGPKLQMQSLQTKIILPTMETVKMQPTQPQPVVRMITTGKTQSNTILIQATQSSSVLSSIVSKVSTSTPQLSPRLTFQTKQRPRLLTSATMLQQAAGKPASTLPPSPKLQQTRQVFQPRMLVHKSRPAMLGNVRSEIQPGSPVPKLVPVPRTQVISQVTQAQVPKQFTMSSTVQSVQKPIQTRPPLLGPKAKVSTARQAVQKTTSNSSPSIPHANTVELMTTQALPPLAPMQLATTCSNEVLSLSHSQAPTMSLPSFQSSGSEQLIPTALGDGSTPPTYMLLTIDEAGNLQPYNSQSLISYDGSEQAGQTIYIDGLESGGDLDNIILTIGNSSSLALDMGQTNTMTNVSSIYNTRAPSSSQDILAAALANTDVFQSEVALQDTLTVVSSNRSSVMTPCVVESSIMLTSPPPPLLLPSMNRAADVSETSLTLNQPIMTPLEIPSSVVSTRAPAPISFPIDLPLSVTQALAVPMTSYTVMNETMSTSESIFQPSMPLLSEEIPDARTATSSHLPHSQITYDAIQEHSELSPYNDTLQIVQDDSLPPHKSLMYQSQLSTQTLDNVQCLQQSSSFFNPAPSEEPHCPTSSGLSASVTTVLAEISEGTSEMSDSLTPASKESDTPTEICKVPNSLTPVLSANSPENSQPRDVGTEDLSLLHLQPSEECNSEIAKFLHTQTESNTTQHSFKNSLQIDDTPDPTINMLDSDNIVKSSEELDDCTTNMSTMSQEDKPPTTRDSILDEVSNQVSHPGLIVMESNIVNHLNELPAPPQTTSEPAGDETDGSPQSMPLLSEHISANTKEQLEDNENTDDCSKSSQDCADSSLNEMSFGESGR